MKNAFQTENVTSKITIISLMNLFLELKRTGRNKLEEINPKLAQGMKSTNKIIKPFEVRNKKLNKKFSG